MKLGLVVHFFDFRNDVRQWINELSKLHELVLFVRPQDRESIEAMAPEGLEFRLIEEKKSSFWNRFWEFAFRFLGKLPESRQNYYLMEQFKFSITDNPALIRKASRWLDFSMALPKILSYDRFLDQLSYTSKTQINDIDQFVCFTELSDNYFVSRLIQEQRSPLVYVYSWDHPCKHLRFSTRLKYLVWHEGIKDDMVNLQHIPAENIQILGATQMGYVDRFLQQKDHFDSPYPFDYVYFGCAIGVPQLVAAELEIVRKVAETMAETVPGWTLVVRPYPVLRDWSHYDALKTLPNVVVDDGFRSAQAQNISVGEAAILEKFIKIEHAKAFLHLGTTLGVEACYTSSPSILLDLKEYSFPEKVLTLHHFIHQFQNDKYLIRKGFPNVIRSKPELKNLFLTLQDQPELFAPYNKKVAADLLPKSFAQVAADFSNALTTSSQ